MGNISIGERQEKTLVNIGNNKAAKAFYLMPHIAVSFLFVSF